MPGKAKSANNISDIKPVKLGVNGPDHLLDDNENQNLDTTIANDGEDIPNVPQISQHELKTIDVDGNNENPDAKVIKNVAGTKIIKPLEKTAEEIEEANNAVQEPATTQVADINYDHPDSSQKMASNMSDNMQTPKFFDTKEYNLPISQSKHSHGFWLGSILAGITFAVVVAGIALFVLNNLSK